MAPLPCSHPSPALRRAAVFLQILICCATESICAGAADFERDIRPLLQDRCIECHGEKKQKGNLRLDSRAAALRGGDDGPALVPSSPEDSRLLQRVTAASDDHRMPPKGEPLSPAQIHILREWIHAGAPWPESDAEHAAVERKKNHWAIQPVQTTFPPGASIDAFIRKTLSEKGLAPSPEADRRTLIRRLNFDLHGLPPAPDRVERFVNDPDPAAYEKLLEELLASPHYGERWARHWLDIAHYADTHGFERDQLRPNAWRYRDYVIDSLNRDKPYHTFLREQIAGDIIDPQNPETLVATGFLAAGPWDFVGQVEARSEVLRRAARAADLDDMVTQVITASLGLTINCARCHDHKIDPIAQREYYGLWSVFAGVKRGERNTDPALSQQLEKEKSAIEQELSAARSELIRLTGGGIDLADIVGGGNGGGTGKPGAGIDVRNGKTTSQKLGYHRDIETNVLRTIEWPEALRKTPHPIQAVFIPDGRNPLKLDERRELSGFPKTVGHSWDAIRNGILNAQHSTTLEGIDYSKPGHSILGMHANSGAVFDLENIRRTHGLRALRLRGVVGFGGKNASDTTRADFTVFVDTEKRSETLRMRKDAVEYLDVPLPETAQTLTLMATDGGDGIGSDLLFIGDCRLHADRAEAEVTDAEKTRIRELKTRIDALGKKLRAVPSAPKVYAVVAEAQPSSVRVQRRGNPEDETGEVEPGALGWLRHAPAAFGDNTLPEGKRRLALAEWIVHPENPLTRRVMVNRLWHHHFGTGIVATPSDFGLGGEAPSHPALLDWLAEELLRSGWSLKHIHRLIVTSATYRQTSLSTHADATAQDAQNRLLWRQNPRRLDAESIRDAVLAVSGNLNTTPGGPGFRDFKYTEAYAPIYEYITPDQPELWRRSIYRFVVRTTPHRLMTTLDCPDPANLTPARVQTTTALQALTLSNNAFILQQARHLADQVESIHTDPIERVRAVFERTLQRFPDPSEKEAASALAREHGLFSLCRMLLNANEFLYID